MFWVSVSLKWYLLYWIHGLPFLYMLVHCYFECIFILKYCVMSKSSSTWPLIYQYIYIKNPFIPKGFPVFSLFKKYSLYTEVCVCLSLGTRVLTIFYTDGSIPYFYLLKISWSFLYINTYRSLFLFFFNSSLWKISNSLFFKSCIVSHLWIP